MEQLAPRKKRLLILGKALLAVLLFVGLLVGVRHLGAQELLKTALDWVAGLGAWGVVAYVALYVLATVLFLPGSILTLGAGVLFGVFKGAIVVSIAATLGALCAFLIGRSLASDWVTARIAGNPRFLAVDQAVAREGWKIVGLTRLSPVFPFNLLNYAFGLTRVSLRDYFWAT
ncbi:MAG: TVP38/TMEM64 family protein [Syntrophotaleaceae bacterium]